MANEKHVEMLMKGVSAWNHWRYENAEVCPELSGARLAGAKLAGANLRYTDLSDALLASSYLRGAMLYGSSLKRADLSRADFIASNLGAADLTNADLVGADLSDANLIKANLNGVNLSNANLNGANLSGVEAYAADLRKADLTDVKLLGSNLIGAMLVDADLRKANLNSVDFSDANLRNANLRKANLYGAVFCGARLVEADFTDADLTKANLGQAKIGRTTFAGNNLREVMGLDNVQHNAPSEVSASTLSLSGGMLPKTFLRGCGFKDWELEVARLYQNGLSPTQVTEIIYRINELRADPLIQFYSCFISYSSKDIGLAQQLYLDLQGRGVRCWFAPEDMKIGDRIRPRLDDSIHLHDKLLLILSETSIASQWIEQEVETALEKEKEQGCDVLFPIRLDDTVMSVRSGWPALIRKTRHIGDFCKWKEAAEYEKNFQRLLSDLRVKAKS